METINLCGTCHDCCKVFELTFENTEATKKKREEILYNFSLYGMEFSGNVKVKCRVEGTCKHLDETNHVCKIYNNRPDRCKAFLCNKFK